MRVWFSLLSQAIVEEVGQKMPVWLDSLPPDYVQDVEAALVRVLNRMDDLAEKAGLADYFSGIASKFALIPGTQQERYREVSQRCLRKVEVMKAKAMSKKVEQIVKAVPEGPFMGL